MFGRTNNANGFTANDLRRANKTMMSDKLADEINAIEHNILEANRDGLVGLAINAEAISKEAIREFKKRGFKISRSTRRMRLVTKRYVNIDWCKVR